MIDSLNNKQLLKKKTNPKHKAFLKHRMNRNTQSTQAYYRYLNNYGVIVSYLQRSHFKNLSINQCCAPAGPSYCTAQTPTKLH